jgi:hypothetical protein
MKRVGPVNSLALSLIALATIDNAARADDAAQTGLAVSIGYTGDLRRNTTGGLAVGTAYSDMLDIGATWVPANQFSDTNLTFNFSAMHVGGDDISDALIGDLHGVNNIRHRMPGISTNLSEFGFGETEMLAARDCSILTRTSIRR